ncbi:hypothetical protein [uncultured Lactobacillus sp.]|uniref:hypothetical protein n=1 Tax=uncultured Lactobacillus sp. TaxID=153152 RepID=UPI002805EA8F|nr:hypothetical protein [uncultured Lactobacillus sp.]
MLKGKKNALNWLTETKKALNWFKYPSLKKLANKNLKQFLTLNSLLHYPQYFNTSHLSKRMNAKYRKILKGNELNGYGSEYSSAGMIMLEKQKDRLEQEINSYLGNYWKK